MKLSDYARRQGVRYETAWRWFRDGKIKGHRVGKHTVMMDEGKPVQPSVESSHLYQGFLRRKQSQPGQPGRTVDRLWCCQGLSDQQSRERNWIWGERCTSEVSGLAGRPYIDVIIVEHKDRASRFGVRYIESLFACKDARSKWSIRRKWDRRPAR